jgi:hypothetical protein
LEEQPMKKETARAIRAKEALFLSVIVLIFKNFRQIKVAIPNQPRRKQVCVRFPSCAGQKFGQFVNTPASIGLSGGIYQNQENFLFICL